MAKRCPWQEAHYSFFQNTQCEYFPCHKGVPAEEFNCLFCYCPLYVLGHHCGGTPRFGDNGVKVCTQCSFPHKRENYIKIVQRYAEIKEAMQQLEQRVGCAGTCAGSGQQSGDGDSKPQ